MVISRLPYPEFISSQYRKTINQHLVVLLNRLYNGIYFYNVVFKADEQYSMVGQLKPKYQLAKILVFGQ